MVFGWDWVFHSFVLGLVWFGFVLLSECCLFCFVQLSMFLFVVFVVGGFVCALRISLVVYVLCCGGFGVVCPIFGFLVCVFCI